MRGEIQKGFNRPIEQLVSSSDFDSGDVSSNLAGPARTGDGCQKKRKYNLTVVRLADYILIGD